VPAALLVAGVSLRRPVDGDHLDFLRVLAGQLATALSTARMIEQQRRIALTLQRSLPPDGEQAFGLETAARYLPGSTDVEVGGDWYDVIHRPAGRRCSSAT
jgi:serine phosphatase RsbU (regulator of sigma subunit)